MLEIVQWHLAEAQASQSLGDSIDLDDLIIKNDKMLRKQFTISESQHRE